MNVLFISQCQKRALTETRRILDQFAERRGDCTWQTPITQAGLDTVRRLLRKSARRNTAVACHWIRGKDHSELLWVVGDASRFNSQGAVPTNTTSHDVLRRDDENDWHSAEDIALLAAMAALFHDFGKASRLFQEKLSNNAKVADPYRHEWVSLRMFQAFVGQEADEQWLQRLVVLGATDKRWLKRLYCDGIEKNLSPQALADMPPLARAIGWLIISHHRLPAPPQKNIGLKTRERLFAEIDANWCGARPAENERILKKCWEIPLEHWPTSSSKWRTKAALIAQRMLQRSGFVASSWLNNPYVAHLARFSLMLADHGYSAGPAHCWLGDEAFAVYANTDNSGNCKQKLDEHLVGVQRDALRIVRALPRLARQLPHIARHKGFTRRSSVERFRWQDNAFELATSIQDRAAEQGFFGVNMASTGCGKTLANGRIMYGLADTRLGARFSIALGLRTLTLQTGHAYRSRLQLSDDELAVLVGGGAVRQLHELQQEQAAQRGSESAADLLPDNSHVYYEGSLDAGPLSQWLQGQHGRQGANLGKLVNAPVLVCTIDHLMPASESTRGGHQLAPLLRLLSSDLVLDEPDDFAMEDLPALTRLVFMAGLLGSKVLLSSATLPPALIQGLFAAYLAGRQQFQSNRGMCRDANVCCGWFDEFQRTASEHGDEQSFIAAHQQFVAKRLTKLASNSEVRRRAALLPLPSPSANKAEIRRQLAAVMLQQAQQLHHQHGVVDPHSGKRVSFGLIRMANVDPLIDVARAMLALGAGESCRVHLCVYHSRHPLLVRSAIEARLDRCLQREKEQGMAIFADPELRQLLDGTAEPDQIFVVLASPVAEVGRDHCYDWAIAEPSSMRSLIQLAGRVRRHRSGTVNQPNILILGSNCKALEGQRPAFCHPGFESQHLPLASYQLSMLLQPDEYQTINAAPRIQARQHLAPSSSLVDLEHARLQALLVDDSGRTERSVRWWWQTPSLYSAIEQKADPFRHDPQGSERFYLQPDEDDGQLQFYQQSDCGPLPSANRFQQAAITAGPRIAVWGAGSYQQELALLAERLAMSEEECARTFGIVDLPKQGNEQGWHYHHVLGFRRVLS